MAKQKRNAVFVALSNTIGHELVFRHYTSKVVAAKYPDQKKAQKVSMKQAGKPRTKK